MKQQQSMLAVLGTVFILAAHGTAVEQTVGNYSTHTVTGSTITFTPLPTPPSD